MENEGHPGEDSPGWPVVCSPSGVAYLNHMVLTRMRGS